MQIKKLIPSLTEQWKKMYEKERPNLSPNAISGEALADYAKERFAAESFADEAFLNAICTDVKNDPFFREKLNGAEPSPAAFRLSDGTFLGMDLVSGWFIAENDAVRDELIAVKGLDEKDLDNVLRTVDYLRCTKAQEPAAAKKRILPPREKRSAEIRDELK